MAVPSFYLRNWMQTLVVLARAFRLRPPGLLVMAIPTPQTLGPFLIGMSRLPLMCRAIPVVRCLMQTLMGAVPRVLLSLPPKLDLSILAMKQGIVVDAWLQSAASTAKRDLPQTSFVSSAPTLLSAPVGLKLLGAPSIAIKRPGRPALARFPSMTIDPLKNLTPFVGPLLPLALSL